MKPVKIAYVLTPVDFGGAERVDLNFLNKVDRNVFDIHPILLVRPWEEENYFIREIREAKYPVRKIPVAIRPPNEGRDYLRVVRCFKILWSILKNDSFDLVHTHGYFADIVGIPIGKILHIPTISTCHGFISNNFKLRLYNMLDRVVLRFSDRIIAVSEEIKKGLVASGISPSKIELLLNAVQSDFDPAVLLQNRRDKRKHLRLSDDDFVVGYVGRLSEEKGIKILFEAILKLIIMGIEVKVLLIGEGPQKKELEGIVKEYDLDKNVFFTGFQENIEKWWPALDVFVLPSLTEGTPMALLEAMSFGIPVIASRVGGVPDIIENQENGVLVKAGNPQDLAQQINALIHNPSIRRKYSENAQNLIRRQFNIHYWCNKIEEQYDLLIKRNLNHWKP